jgi:hypothetical protein
MVTFKVDTGDMSDDLYRQLERKLADCLRRDGLHNVTVKVDRQTGQAVFSGSDADLKRVSEVKNRWRL